jgi:hypothetical protein
VSVVVRCDLKGCLSMTAEHAGNAWLHVERSGELTSRDQDPGPWDFCSWEHLGAFASGVVA